MISVSTSVGRALTSALRLGPALGLVAALLASLLGVSSPVSASDASRQTAQQTALAAPGDPAARLQVIIKSIHVNNDRDGFWTGDGDLQLASTFWRCTGPNPPCGASNTDPPQLMAQWKRNFQAASGETKALDHVLPIAADVKDGNMASEEEGLVVRSGDSYVFQISVFEKDAVGGDLMGGIQRVVNESNGWGVGTYELEPARIMDDGSIPSYTFVCAGNCGIGGVIAGDYTISYEIRRTPLPDLHPTAIRLVDAAPGPETTDPNVCLTVENRGAVDAGPFGIVLAVDQSTQAGGSTSLPGLAAGGTQERCIYVALPDSGTHQLSLTADANLAVPESDETNNELAQSFTRTGPGRGKPTPTTGPTPGAGPGPKPNAPVLNAAPSPSATQADLVVGAIKINGQAPDGKNDCKDGKNLVTVVVKNAGAGKAAGFAVRLDTGDAQDGVGEQSVNGLEPGKEREVRFEDVRLKKDERELTATVDAKKTVRESDEDNNEQTVTARCTDAG